MASDDETDRAIFDILPAIDLRGGRAVRLRQGDFAQETAFSDDPISVVRDFADAGARWLHVVDLEGARTGVPAHRVAIAAIVDGAGERLAVEVAGGLRDFASVGTALEAGAARVVIGTAALREPAFAGRLVAAHGAHRVVVAIDVRDGRAVGQGWSADAPSVDAANVIRELADEGVAIFEVTAIDRDGMLRGPDLALYERLVALDRGSIIASAGIASFADVTEVRAVGCRGAIIGRALYDGSLDLRDVLDVAALATLGQRDSEMKAPS